MMTEKSTSIEAPWYSYQGGAYHGTMPAYYDGTDFEWLERGRHLFPELSAEIGKLITENEKLLAPYFHEGLITKKGSWKGLSFILWDKMFPENGDRCPKTLAFLKSIPGLTSASLSVLDPQADILPHYGDTNTVIRAHLGLQIPDMLPNCGIEVNGIQRSWKASEWILFCDAHLHRAWNKTNARRYVLIIDVLHPEYSAQRKEICDNVRSLHSLQRLEKKFPFVLRLPGKIRGILRRALKYGIFAQ